MSNAFNCRKLCGPMGEQIGNYLAIYFYLLLSSTETLSSLEEC